MSQKKKRTTIITNSANITKVADMKATETTRIGGGGAGVTPSSTSGRKRKVEENPRLADDTGDGTDDTGRDSYTKIDNCENVTVGEDVGGRNIVLGGGGEKSVPAEPTQPPANVEGEDCYKMEANPRGWCYIFNNKEFEESPNRLGTDKDRDDIAKIFKDFKFKVRVLPDLSADEMEASIKRLSTKVDHTEFDCVVVVFLTHGRDGVVLGTDDESLSIQHIASLFKSHACPSLTGKPKLFFFQSCRGRVFQKGHKVKPDGPDDEEWSFTEAEKLAAPEADFFFGYATVPGTKAARNEENGGWYIQELTTTLRERAHRDDFLSMMTTVKDRVDQRQAESTGGSVLKQTAESTSRLRKKIYFKPKA